MQVGLSHLSRGFQVLALPWVESTTPGFIAGPSALPGHPCPHHFWSLCHLGAGVKLYQFYSPGSQSSTWPSISTPLLLLADPRSNQPSWGTLGNSLQHFTAFSLSLINHLKMNARWVTACSKLHFRILTCGIKFLLASGSLQMPFLMAKCWQG